MKVFVEACSGMNNGLLRMTIFMMMAWIISINDDSNVRGYPIYRLKKSLKSWPAGWRNLISFQSNHFIISESSFSFLIATSHLMLLQSLELYSSYFAHSQTAVVTVEWNYGRFWQSKGNAENCWICFVLPF